jgi:hypothetical protein
LLRWQEAAATSGHVLFASRTRAGREVKVLTFDRHIDVVWSPEGHHLAITDYAASSDSLVYVVDLETGNVVNVEDEMRRTLKSSPPVYANGHRYFRAIDWAPPLRLRFEVRAYDALPDRDVRVFFTYDAKDRVVR